MFGNYRDLQEAVKNQGIVPGNPMAQSLQDARSCQAAYLSAIAGTSIEIAVHVSDVQLEGPIGPFTLRLLKSSRPGVGDMSLAPVVVLVRGGGWWFGTLEAHERTAKEILLKTGCAVCMVDYHHAPEARFPVQRDELLLALRWLRSGLGADAGLDGERIIMFGESAGATLCLSASQYCRDTALDMPDAMILFYPNATGPKEGGRPYANWVWKHYLRPGPTVDSAAIPMLNSMDRLCPIWLAIGEDDPLLGEVEMLRWRLEQAGVPTIYKCYPSLPHGFVGCSGSVQPAQDAFTDSCDAINRYIDSIPHSSTL